jgi:hypothetical protein
VGEEMKKWHRDEESRGGSRKEWRMNEAIKG